MQLSISGLDPTLIRTEHLKFKVNTKFNLGLRFCILSAAQTQLDFESQFSGTNKRACLAQLTDVHMTKRSLHKKYQDANKTPLEDLAFGQVSFSFSE